MKRSYLKKRKQGSILNDYSIVPVLKKEPKPKQKLTENDIAFIACVPNCFKGIIQ